MRGMISIMYEQMTPRWMFQYKVGNAGSGYAMCECVHVHMCVCTHGGIRMISETNAAVVKSCKGLGIPGVGFICFKYTA